MAKTKVELEQEIKVLRDQLSTAKGEMETASRVEAKDKAATELYEQYESFVKAGFSEEQAWELTRILVDNSTTPKKTSLF